MAVSHSLAPAAADVDLVAVGAFVKCMERALSDTASAVVAVLAVDNKLSVLDGGSLHRAGRLNLADLAAVAEIAVELRDSLADDTQVVEVWLYAVVGAAADRNFELMRKLYAGIAVVEDLVDLVGQRIGIQKSVLAGGSLAGYNRASEGTTFH